MCPENFHEAEYRIGGQSPLAEKISKQQHSRYDMATSHVLTAIHSERKQKGNRSGRCAGEGCMSKLDITDKESTDK